MSTLGASACKEIGSNRVVAMSRSVHVSGLSGVVQKVVCGTHFGTRLTTTGDLIVHGDIKRSNHRDVIADTNAASDRLCALHRDGFISDSTHFQRLELTLTFLRTRTKSIAALCSPLPQMSLFFRLQLTLFTIKYSSLQNQSFPLLLSFIPISSTRTFEFHDQDLPTQQIF